MQELSKKGQGENIARSLALIFGGCFLVALTITCFLSPIWDAFDKWMDKDIRHSIYFFLGVCTVGAVSFIYITAKKI